MIRGREKKIIPSWLISIFGLVVVILIILPLAKNISKKMAVEKEIIGLEEEIGRLETANSDLEIFLAHLDSPEFIEEQARLNLGMKKQGEEVVVLKKDELSFAAIAQRSEREENISNPERWWRYFFQ